jgi:hypothetical protein
MICASPSWPIDSRSFCRKRPKRRPGRDCVQEGRVGAGAREERIARRDGFIVSVDFDVGGQGTITGKRYRGPDDTAASMMHRCADEIMIRLP